MVWVFFPYIGGNNNNNDKLKPNVKEKNGPRIKLGLMSRFGYIIIIIFSKIEIHFFFFLSDIIWVTKGLIFGEMGRGTVI